MAIIRLAESVSGSIHLVLELFRFCCLVFVAIRLMVGSYMAVTSSNPTKETAGRPGDKTDCLFLHQLAVRMMQRTLILHDPEIDIVLQTVRSKNFLEQSFWTFVDES